MEKLHCQRGLRGEFPGKSSKILPILRLGNGRQLDFLSIFVIIKKDLSVSSKKRGDRLEKHGRGLKVLLLQSLYNLSDDETIISVSASSRNLDFLPSRVEFGYFSKLPQKVSDSIIEFIKKVTRIR